MKTPAGRYVLMFLALGIASCGGGSSGSGSGQPTGNAQPTASFTATPTSGVVPLTVQFDASSSVDSDGSISTYNWNFGDGTATASGIAVSHTFNSLQSFTVTLTVIDNLGATGSTTRQVSVASPSKFSLTHLGAMAGGDQSWGYDINASGQVSGYSSLGGGQTVLWDPETEQVKLLPGNGWSINDAGEAPGVSYQDPATGTTYIPSCTLAINNVGMAAGEFGTAAELHACVWDYKTHKATDLHALLPLATYSSAKAISDSGYVVGWFRNPPFLPNEQGFIVDLNKGEAYLLGDLRGGLSYAGAVSVNNFGQVVGHSGVTDTVGHAFLWDIATKTIRDLGDLPGGIDSSHAYDINDSGLVVGWSHGARTPYQPYTSAASGQGFLWAADSGMRNLNDLIDPADPLKPYVEIIEARGINNRGQISASGVDRRTLQIHAFLMTPIP